jgi:hypothetical protein
VTDLPAVLILADADTLQEIAGSFLCETCVRTLWESPDCFFKGMQPGKGDPYQRRPKTPPGDVP